VSERAAVETMARRLEELRRAAGNSELRGAYAAAIDALDAVLYRLAMLRRLEPPKPTRRQMQTSVTASPPPLPPQGTTPVRAVAARIGAARKPRR
jgi:hypothetical protein